MSVINAAWVRTLEIRPLRAEGLSTLMIFM